MGHFELKLFPIIDMREKIYLRAGPPSSDGRPLRHHQRGGRRLPPLPI